LKMNLKEILEIYAITVVFVLLATMGMSYCQITHSTGFLCAGDPEIGGAPQLYPFIKDVDRLIGVVGGLPWI